jgi:hypothetical protein
MGTVVKHLDGSIGILLDNWTGMTQAVHVLADGKQTIWSVYDIQVL